MLRGFAIAGVVLAALLAVRCASSPARDDQAVVQFIDIRNESGEPVVVTARVGASGEQRLGFMEQAAFRRFTLSTGAASEGTIFLRARNPETGREASAILQAAPGRTLEWSIRF